MHRHVSGQRRVSFDRLLAGSYWSWRSNPALSVPAMLNGSVSVLGQSVLGIFGIALVVRLEGSGTLSGLVAMVAGGRYAEAARLALSPPVFSIILAYAVPAVAASLVVSVLAMGFALSSEYGSYQLVLKGGRVGVAEVMGKLRERWRAMAWTHLLSSAIWLLPTLLPLTLLLALLYYGLPGVALTTLLLLAGLALSAVLSLMLIYSEVVVFFEGVSGLSAISASMARVRRNKGIALTYALVDVFLSGLILSLVSLVPGANLPLSSLASVGVGLVLTPVLHLTKTSIYVETQKQGGEPFELRPSVLKDMAGPLVRFLWSRFRAGLAELWSYVSDPANLKYHAAAAAAMVLGTGAGIAVGDGGLAQGLLQGGYAPGRINPLVANSVPFSLGFYIFLHNWQVSMATALSGVWFSVAPLTELMLNGVILGIAYTLTPNFTMFAAAIFPHGVLEIPSFVLAGSAGIRLGVWFWRSARSDDPGSTVRFYAVARQSVYIVVGLALLFLVAGFIEGNVTPIIMRMYGWS